MRPRLTEQPIELSRRERLKHRPAASTQLAEQLAPRRILFHTAALRDTFVLLTGSELHKSRSLAPTPLVMPMKSIRTALATLLISTLTFAIGCEDGGKNPIGTGGQGGENQGGGGSGGTNGGSLSLDTTYGTSGVAHADRQRSNDFIIAGALMNDGSILLGGSTESMLGVVQNEPLLARYTAAGAIDTTFGEGGFIVLPWGDRAQVKTIETLSDNGFLIAGLWQRYGRDWAFIAHLDAQGKPDASFGTAGITLVETDSSKNHPLIARTASGAIWLLTNAQSGTQNQWLWRLNEKGQVDTTFGTDGHTEINGKARDLLVSPTGEVLTLVIDSSSSNVYRFQPDGTPDNTFGTAGVTAIPFEVFDLEVNAMGELLIGGATGNLMKLDAQGAPAAAFGGSGSVSVGVEDVVSAKWLANGDILVADGDASNFPRRSFHNVVRLGPDGSPVAFDDTTTKAIGSAFNLGAMLIKNDQVILAGDKWKTLGNQETTLYAIQTNGTPVTSFGTNGTVKTGSQRQPEVMWSFAFAPDKSLVTYGISRVPLITHIVNGQIDAGFASGGYIELFPTAAGALTVDGMGRILESSGPGAYLNRYDPKGMLDSAYGMNGTITLMGGLFVNALKIDSKQRVVAGGNSTQPSNVFVARLLADGTHDSSFGTAGVIDSAQILKEEPIVQDVFVNADDSMILAGRHYPTPAAATHLFLVRLLENGSVDTGFGTNGVLSVDAYLSQPRMTARKSGGHLIAGMDHTCASKVACSTVVIAIDAKGALDPSFGTGGIAQIEGGTHADGPTGIAELADETIVVTGAVEENATQKFAIWRLGKDGSPDPTGPFVLPGKGRSTSALVDGTSLYVGGWLFDPKTGTNMVTLRFNN